MEKKYIIYCYTNQINNKKYIGQTSTTLKERSGSDGCDYRNKSIPEDSDEQPIFYKAIRKYKWDNFIPTILETNLTLEEANKREQYWIAFYHTWIEDPQCWGYNMQPGGNNHKMSEETKEKLREKFSGENNPFYGKHHTEESIQKIKEHLPNKEGKNNPFYGKHHTEESKQKISKSKQGQGSKAIHCITTNEFFNSIREASKKYNISRNLVFSHSGIFSSCSDYS